MAAAWGNSFHDDGDSEIEDVQPLQSDEFDDWEASDGGEEPAHSLFDPAMRLESPLAAVAYDAAQHTFDLLQYLKQAGIHDSYDVLRLINFIRSNVAAATDPRPTLTSWLSSLHPSPSSPGPEGTQEHAPWAGDAFLIPVLPDDAMLTYDWDDHLAAPPPLPALAALPLRVQQQPESSGQGQEAPAASAAAPAGGSQMVAGMVQALEASGVDLPGLLRAVAELQAENRQLREALVDCRRMTLPDELQEEAELQEAAALQAAAAAASSSTGGEASGSSSAALAPAAAVAAAVAQGAAPSPGALAQQHTAVAQQVDESYFDSYSSLGIHQQMLSDTPRTSAYMEALEENPALMRGASVLDLGCGTGILSLFAARAGARCVVALDGSDYMAKLARKVADANGYGAAVGGPLHVVASRVEALEQLPGGLQQVDVIVSEWMGYALLFESMLDSVLVARDRFLRPGGALLPDRARIFLAGAAPECMGSGFWQDVYGFDMSPMGELAVEGCQGQACVRSVDPHDLVTNTVALRDLDLLTMTAADQDFSTPFALTASAQRRPAFNTKPPATDATPAAQLDGSSSSGAGGAGGPSQPQAQQPGKVPGVEVAAMVVWFDTEFSKACCQERPVLLSTSPHAPHTHWAQTVLPLQQPVRLCSADTDGTSLDVPWATEITGTLSMARNRRKHRSLDIALHYKATRDGVTVAEGAAVYAMEVLRS